MASYVNAPRPPLFTAGLQPVQQSTPPPMGRPPGSSDLTGFGRPEPNPNDAAPVLGINPADFPGVPAHILKNMTRDASGQLWYKPGGQGEPQAVKMEGGQMRYDPNPMNPAAGQWGDYSQPTGDGFTGTRNGKNYFRGHLFAAEGLNQGGGNDGLGVGFGNWLRQHIPTLLSQLPADSPERAGLQTTFGRAGGALGPGGTGMAPGQPNPSPPPPVTPPVAPPVAPPPTTPPVTPPVTPPAPTPPTTTVDGKPWDPAGTPSVGLQPETGGSTVLGGTKRYANLQRSGGLKTTRALKGIAKDPIGLTPVTTPAAPPTTPPVTPPVAPPALPPAPTNPIGRDPTQPPTLVPGVPPPGSTNPIARPAAPPTTTQSDSGTGVIGGSGLGRGGAPDLSRAGLGAPPADSTGGSAAGGPTGQLKPIVPAGSAGSGLGRGSGNFADAIARSQVNGQTVGAIPGARSTRPTNAPGLTAAPASNPIARDPRSTMLFADGGRVEVGYADGGTSGLGRSSGVPNTGGGTGELFTYQDYLNFFNAGRSMYSGESTALPEPLTPQQWASMPQEQRWNLVGGQIPILPGDPRYDALKPRVGGEEGRAIWVRGSAPPANGIVPGARVERGSDGSYVFSEDSRTPEWQAQDEGSDLFRTFLIAAALMVGGAAAMGAFSAGATVGTQMGAAAGQGFGTAAGGAGATGAAGAAAGGGIGLTAEGSAGIGAGASGAGTVDVAALAANPAVQGAASNAGMSVTQWLSNPQNLMTAARIAGGVGSLIAGGGRGNGNQVGLIPPPGGLIPPPGGTTPGGTGVPAAATPTPVASNAQLTARPEEAPLDPAFLASLDPANFQGGNADLTNWRETRARFRPLEDMLFGEAMEAGSAAEQEAAAGQANADVEQAFSSAEQQQRARLMAQGVNVDSGVGPGAELSRLATLDKAKAAAGAKNIARRGEKDRGLAARMNAAGVGGQLAGQALNADNIGLQYEQGNRRIALDAAGRRADLGFRAHEGAADRTARAWDSSQDREFRRGEGEADRTWRSGESATDRTWRSGESGADRELRRQIANADIAAGNRAGDRQYQQDRGRGIGEAINTGIGIYRFGNDVGWWADGGRVRDIGLGTEAPKRKRRDYRDGARVEGPGTGTSDSIRARLSDGEGVLNAEAMEVLDATEPGKLDELNEQGLKIRMVRKMLKSGMMDGGGMGMSDFGLEG